MDLAHSILGSTAKTLHLCMHTMRGLGGRFGLAPALGFVLGCALGFAASPSLALEVEIEGEFETEARLFFERGDRPKPAKAMARWLA